MKMIPSTPFAKLFHMVSKCRQDFPSGNPWLTVGAFLLVCMPGFAQPNLPQDAKLDKGFAASHYERKGDGQKALQSTFLGQSAVRTSPEQILVKDFKMTTYADGDPNKPQLIVTAPECFLDVDPQSHRASSTNRLRVSTVSTNFVLEGQGFSCTQTNELLVISNSVATRLPRPAKNTKNRLANTSALSTQQADPNSSMLIFSDRFEFRYASNLVIYSGHVRVVDKDATMQCDYLQARLVKINNRFDTNTSVDQIIAERNVFIDTKDQGQAFGDHAMYWVRPEGDLVELTGNARWQDGLRESRADKFTFEQGLRRMHADGKASVKIPDSELATTNVAGVPINARDTNQFTELFAEHLTVQMPETNGIESITADQDLVITNRFKQVRAVADRGTYSRVADEFDLQGNAVLESAIGDELRAQSMRVGRTNWVFSAKGDSRLKMRIHGTPAGLKLPNSPAARSTNNFLIVNSQESEFRTNMATFTDNVRTSVVQDDRVSGTMTSDLLQIRFEQSNRVPQSVYAKGKVIGNATPNGTILKRGFSADSVLITFWPGTNLLQSANAEGKVSAEQIEQTKGTQKITRLNAGNVLARFASLSNAVDHAIATKNASATQIEGTKTNIVQGQKVDYDGGTNRVVVVTGNPLVQYFGPEPAAKTNQSASATVKPSAITRPRGILGTGATSLIWDMKTDKVWGTGPYKITPIELPESPATTNSTNQ